MKKLYFSIFFLCNIIPFAINSRYIKITTEDENVIYSDDQETIAEFFRKCRNDGFCKNSKQLTLYFGNYQIIENSEASNKRFACFNSLSNDASVIFNKRDNKNRIDRLHESSSENIFIRASNGMVQACAANQTPAHFFRSCRSAGHCLNTDPMILKFGDYEIKENTIAANKPFCEFHTNANYAFTLHTEMIAQLGNELYHDNNFYRNIMDLGLLYFIASLFRSN